MKESEKLTIRFNFKSPQEKIINEKVGSDYHWGRIIGCALAVVAVGSLLIVGNNHFFNQNESVHQQAETPVTDIKEAMPLITTTSIESKAEVKINAEDINSPTVNESELETFAKANADTNNEVKTKVNTETLDDVTDKVEEQTTLAKEALSSTIEENEESVGVAGLETKSNQNSPVSAGIINTEVLPIVEEKISPEIPLITTEESKKTVATIQSDNSDSLDVSTQEKNTQASTSQTSPQEKVTSTSVFTQSHIEIKSDNVQRFIIAPRVINNEPVGTISDIKFEKNIAGIFAFTEVTDLKDTSLYYYWRLNGEEVTKVRVDVGGKRWRTYSSKVIQPHMRGEWTVEMQNKNGETLAISRFTY